jgi:ABC-type transporter Mla subunit MlaD
VDATRAKGILRLAILALAVAGLFFVIRASKYGIVFGHPARFDHYLQTTVPSAFEALPGERVLVNGIDAGQLTRANVTKTGQAHLVLGIRNRYWPLPADTKFQMRMSGTIKYTDRFVAVYRGHASQRFANDGSIPTSQFQVPVEYGQFFNIFNQSTRQSMTRLFGEAGPTLTNAVAPFQQTLPVAAGPLNQGAAIFNDLGYSQRALSTLVSSGAQLTKAIATSNPGLQTLLDGAASTFQATAQESTEITQLLNYGHRTNIGIGNILFHVTRTFPKIVAMARGLNPGLTKADELTAPFNGTLRELTSLEPAAVHTLNTVHDDAPTIDTLLSTARTQLLPQLQSVSSQAATELNCIRPFTPDIMNVIDGFAGFNGELPTATTPHLNAFHGQVSILPIPSTMTTGTVQLHQLLPNLNVGTHPPGTGWNQPWYQPQCGITPAANVATGDPENGAYDPGGTKLIPYASTTPDFGPLPRRDTPPGS